MPLNIVSTGSSVAHLVPFRSCWVKSAFAINHHILWSLGVPRQLSTHPSFPLHSSFTFPSFYLIPFQSPWKRTPPLLNYFPWTCVSLAADTDDLTFKKPERRDEVQGGLQPHRSAGIGRLSTSIICTVESHTGTQAAHRACRWHTQARRQEIDVFSSADRWQIICVCQQDRNVNFAFKCIPKTTKNWISKTPKFLWCLDVIKASNVLYAHPHCTRLQNNLKSFVKTVKGKAVCNQPVEYESLWLP